jgi:hypothetical protein
MLGAREETLSTGRTPPVLDAAAAVHRAQAPTRLQLRGDAVTTTALDLAGQKDPDYPRAEQYLAAESREAKAEDCPDHARIAILEFNARIRNIRTVLQDP